MLEVKKAYAVEAQTQYMNLQRRYAKRDRFFNKCQYIKYFFEYRPQQAHYKHIIEGGRSACSRHTHSPFFCGCAAHWKVSSFRPFSRRCHSQLHAELLFCQNIRSSHQHPAAEASALFPLITKISGDAVLPVDINSERINQVTTTPPCSVKCSGKQVKRTWGLTV